MNNSVLDTCIPCPKIENDCYDWYQRHELKLKQVSEKKFDLILIGDSITHFWHDEGGMVNEENEKVWQACFSKYRTLNLGYGFDRPQNVLWRLDHGELAGQDPRVIVLNIGTNCFSITENYPGNTPEEAFNGVKAVIEKIFSMFPETFMILMEVFPRNPEEKQRSIDLLNEKLREYSKSEKRIHLLSLFRKLTKNSVLDPEYYRPDQCHLNAAGYRIWGKALEEILEQHLEERGS